MQAVEVRARADVACAERRHHVVAGNRGVLADAHGVQVTGMTRMLGHRQREVQRQLAQRRVVGAGERLAAFDPPVQALELMHADRGRHVVHGALEPRLGDVVARRSAGAVPVPGRRRQPVQREALDALGLRGIADDERSAFDRRHVLRRVEAERAEVAPAADRPSAPASPDRVRGVLDDRDPEPRAEQGERIEVDRVPAEVDGEQRPRVRPREVLRVREVEQAGARIAVDEDGRRAAVLDDVRARRERVGRHEHLVAGADVAQQQRQRQTRGARVQAAQIRRLDVLRQLGLEALNLRPARQPPGRQRGPDLFERVLVDIRAGDPEEALVSTRAHRPRTILTIGLPAVWSAGVTTGRTRTDVAIACTPRLSGGRGSTITGTRGTQSNGLRSSRCQFSFLSRRSMCGMRHTCGFRAWAGAGWAPRGRSLSPCSNRS